MKTIILTNGIDTEKYEVTEADFAQTMNLARLTAEAWGEGWEAKEPQPEVAEPQSEVDEPQEAE